MRKRVMAVIWAFVMGVFCPLFIVSVTKKEFLNDEKPVNVVETTKDISIRQPEQISVLFEDGSVKELDLKKYLISVLLEEVPASFEMEALKAQAVVARTYVLRRLESGSKHNGATVCTESSCCQGFCDRNLYLENGGTCANLEKIENAVTQTENLVVTYNGDLIDATYFSCSGGKTEDAVAVWGADIPYLKTTSSPGEEKATHYVDTVTFEISTFLKSLGLKPEGASEQWIEDTKYTAGGGVESIRICGVDFPGTEVRQLLNLRSTAFRIAIVGNTVTVTTKGFGHRVGLSQYGADAMASSGATFEQILTHYYSGTQVTEYSKN